MLTTATMENLNLNESSKLPLVMLVDDSEINNYVNGNILRRYEFSERILTYEDSTEAFDYLKEASEKNLELPSIIFLDLNMPIMDGRMFVEKFDNLPFRARNFCKIIILSSSANPHDKARMLNNKNVFAYFSPPLIKSNLEEVSTILRKLNPVLPFPKILSNFQMVNTERKTLSYQTYPA